MASLVTLTRIRHFLFPERGVVLPRPYAVVAAAGIAVGVLLGLTDQGQRLEWNLYDRFTRGLITNDSPAPDVVVVAIDEPSFAEVGMAWPWPRSMHAALVDQLVQGGARTIAFDVLFDTPGADPEDDALFAEAIQRAGNVVLAADHAVIEDRGYALEQWSEPLSSFSAAAAGVGVVRIPQDPDGVLRRAQLVYQGRPSLAWAIAGRANRGGAERGGQALRVAPTQHAMPDPAPPAQHAMPDPAAPAQHAMPDPAAPRLFRWNGEPRRGVITVSYYQALDAANSLPPGIFRDKHVLVGRSLQATSIDQMTDHFRTPVSVQTPGVEIHATIVDAILRDRFIADPLAHPAAVIALSVVAAAALSAALYFVGPVAAPALAAGAILIALAASYAGFVNAVRVPAVAPMLTLASAYAFTAAYRYGLATSERRMIKRAFQHYVSPAIVEQMLADPSKLKLGGEEYEVTVLFSDLEGFTTLSEHLTPAELSAHLGEYFKEMLDVLLPRRGTLDKLIGDAIMMYFGCPIPDSRHAIEACRGALAMQERMVALNDAWGRQSLPRLRTRIGINTGVAIAGNMGTNTIFNYTIIGDCVNLASRLEGVNKEYGTLTIIGEDTWTLVHEEFETRELDWIRVKGKSQPVAIYELAAAAGRLDAKRREVFAHFAQGLSLYRQACWAEAADAFARALALDPDDGPSRVFATRCTYYQVHVPEPWDGVHVMHYK